mgnify:CR=1 FL=1
MASFFEKQFGMELEKVRGARLCLRAPVETGSCDTDCSIAPIGERGQVVHMFSNAARVHWSK